MKRTASLQGCLKKIVLSFLIIVHFAQTVNLHCSCDSLWPSVLRHSPVLCCRSINTIHMKMNNKNNIIRIKWFSLQFSKYPCLLLVVLSSCLAGAVAICVSLVFFFYCAWLVTKEFQKVLHSAEQSRVSWEDWAPEEGQRRGKGWRWGSL